ncbi:MAG: hypothetical protein PHV93_03340 [Candidatus Pacebacteria bacterium]|nr:hypothetical protein [Candidatus Paceibacterota bacterium]
MIPLCDSDRRQSSLPSPSATRIEKCHTKVAFFYSCCGGRNRTDNLQVMQITSIFIALARVTWTMPSPVLGVRRLVSTPSSPFRDELGSALPSQLSRKVSPNLTNYH